MNYKELSKYEKERFNKAACPICGKRIFSADPFILIKVRNSRYTVYNFLHEACLAKKHELFPIDDDFMPVPVDFEDSEGHFSASERLMPEGIHSDNIDAIFIG